MWDESKTSPIRIDLITPSARLRSALEPSPEGRVEKKQTGIVPRWSPSNMGSWKSNLRLLVSKKEQVKKQGSLPENTETTQQHRQGSSSAAAVCVIGFKLYQVQSSFINITKHILIIIVRTNKKKMLIAAPLSFERSFFLKELRFFRGNNNGDSVFDAGTRGT